MERIAMSQEERDWLDWLKRARDGQVTQKWVADKMGVSDRWVRRLLVEMKEKGDAVVVHGLRGRPSNRRIDEETRGRAMELVKSPDWHDFKPTFASEQLAKRHQIQVSKETVRQWMIAEGIWRSKGRKVREVHAWRPRRSHYGELVQWDTSDHDWLEGRGEPVHHLVRMIDDATSRSWGRFVQRDGTRENMGVLWEYVKRFGRAVDYYTDRDSMFAVVPRPGESKEQQREADRLTQIGRALRELGIGWIAAYSPQAKGRVERSFLTDQDRLIKQLRLAKVKTMQAANDFLIRLRKLLGEHSSVQSQQHAVQGLQFTHRLNQARGQLLECDGLDGTLRRGGGVDGRDKIQASSLAFFDEACHFRVAGGPVAQGRFTHPEIGHGGRLGVKGIGLMHDAADRQAARPGDHSRRARFPAQTSR